MIFVDESIQHELGYICVAFVYCSESPDQLIDEGLVLAQLVPGEDEYKSGIRMIDAPHRQMLRKRFTDIIRTRCQIGIYVAPVEERTNLLQGVVQTARSIVMSNRLTAPQELFIDEGIEGCVPPNIVELVVRKNCDSRVIRGVQLADYAAYHCSYMLKYRVTGKDKRVLVDLPVHPKSQEEVELEWLIRADLRRSFFMELRNVDEILGDDWFFRLEGYGAFFSKRLPAPLAMAARESFESMYMGCIL